MSGPVPTARVDTFANMDDFEVAAARTILTAITGALHDRHACLLGLSGGRTPRGVYRHVGKLLVDHSVDLRRVQVIFVDERMVPPDDPESNYRMVQDELLARVMFPPSHIHRIQGELRPEIAARAYEREVETLLATFHGRCDLIVLGVGADGHTASLFPGDEVLHERQHAVRAVVAPDAKSWRVTLTLPAINRSRSVLFLATGEEKATIVGTIFASTQAREEIPATMVRPDVGAVRWMLDANAACQIPTELLSHGADAPDAPRAEGERK